MNTQESATASQADQQTGPALEPWSRFQTGPAPTAAVIWLHGLGADGHDFEPVVPQLLWPDAPDIRFVFPHAPVRPVTINGGMAMRAWYDIVSLTSDRDQDQQGIAQSVNQAAALVRRERERGIAHRAHRYRRVFPGRRHRTATGNPLPGNTGRPDSALNLHASDHRLESDRHEANRDLPIFVGHGTSDPVVPCHLGEMLAERMRGMGHPVEWHSYPMQHAVCPQEIADLSAWLRNYLT